MDDLSEERESFIRETLEALTDLDQDLLSLERSVDDATVGRVFRTLHTIKGTSGFLDFAKIERITHASETLMAGVRDRTIALDGNRLKLLLRAADWLRETLQLVRTTGTDASAPDPVRLLSALQESTTATPPTAALEASGGAVPAEPAAPRAIPAEPPETTIRVDVRRLDRFMNAAGELVLVRNQIVRQVGSGRMPSTEALQQLSSLASRLHDSAMQVRMQPIGRLWKTLPRIIHDLARSLGKEAELVMEGTSTELDRAVLEAIRDPLVHAVRNALDHGIEPPEVREKAGKRRQGRLLLRAWHADGQIQIVVEDDGAGIDLERVRSKAVERGLLDRSRAATANDAELIELLFQPGFSTAESVSRVSGRGVGMDVVRSSLQRVSGTVQLTSRAGQGSRLLMTMPLTLAIGSALVVRAGDHHYAIPQTSIHEVVRISNVESFQGAPVFRLREQLVPLVRLLEVLESEQRPSEECRVAVIVRGDGRSFALAVDEVLDMQEIVMKPLPPWLRRARTFVGLTILGDGAVAVILDTGALGRRGQVASKGPSHASPATASEPGPAEQPQDFVLLIGDGSGGHQALPMRDVLRVEQLERSAVQQVENRAAIEYEGGILPLIELTRSAPMLDELNVVVTRWGERRVGLLVDEIIDIASAAPREGTSPSGYPVVVANGQLAVLRDVAEICASGEP